MQILEILLESFANVTGHAGDAAAGLHRVERSGEGDGEIVEVALKIAVAGKTEAADDANDGGGVGVKALGHGANAQEDVIARMLENGPDNFLALGAEEFDALRERRSRGLKRNLRSFHGARELPKICGVSTRLNSYFNGEFEMKTLTITGQSPMQSREKKRIGCDLASTSKRLARVNGQFVASFLRGCGFFFESRCDNGLKEGHHGTQPGAELLDGMALLALASGEEVRATSFIFRDPFLGETAVANFGEDLAHFFACFLRDDARAGGVIAMFGSVTDRITHVAEAAAVDEIDDELEFVHAFKISDFGLIASGDEGVEARFDELADAAAEDGLFTEEIRFGFFGERGFEDAGARAAESFAVGEREGFGAAAGILFNGD